MASLKGNRGSDKPYTADEMAGQIYADNAITSTALALLARQTKRTSLHLHLFALGVELALKSVCLRNGASTEDCRKTNHRITAMIALAERHGTVVPPNLKERLGDDTWFRDLLLLSRYPTLDTELTMHSNYPEMIAEILEIPCKNHLRFEGGSAKAEISARVSVFRVGAELRQEI